MGINTVIAIPDRPHLSIHWLYDALASCQVRKTTKAPSLFIILGTIQMTISMPGSPGWCVARVSPSPKASWYCVSIRIDISLYLFSHCLDAFGKSLCYLPLLALPSGCNIRAPGDPSLRLKAIMAPHLGEIWPSPKWDVTVVHLEEE
ncbi:hypothetical protein CGLO_05871 [Colletotrichum gloeosporioides Cg-14]|uniref:Uncharacterized protein n=1 Tax=Colletotrichum gloeosporioides (strain Cg-14) TaxID=1237896 RepID=T0KQG4_COLGC|nr:hypothetical protein CGLO_05871 [Colletotrichum gloeosporioides Cg-14]